MDVDSNTTHTEPLRDDIESAWAPPTTGHQPNTVAADVAPASQVRLAQPAAYADGELLPTDVARTTTRAEIVPAAFAAGVASLVLLVIGGITTARAGIDRPLDRPIVEVGSFHATAVVGIIELAFGVVFLACAVARSRQATLFFAAVGLAGSLVAYFQPDLGDGTLGIERSGAAAAAAAMAVVVVISLLPSVRRTSTSITHR